MFSFLTKFKVGVGIVGLVDLIGVKGVIGVVAEFRSCWYCPLSVSERLIGSRFPLNRTQPECN
jgi:hypothetical protein